MYSFMNLFLSVSSLLSSMTLALAFLSKSAKLLLLSSSTSICDLMMDIQLLRCYKQTCNLSICSLAYLRYSSTFDYDSFAFLASSPSCLFTSLRSASRSSNSAQRSVSLLRRSEFQLRRPMIQLYIIIIMVVCQQSKSQKDEALQRWLMYSRIKQRTSARLSVTLECSAGILREDLVCEGEASLLMLRLWLMVYNLLFTPQQLWCDQRFIQKIRLARLARRPQRIYWLLLQGSVGQDLWVFQEDLLNMRLFLWDALESSMDLIQSWGSGMFALVALLMIFLTRLGLNIGASCFAYRFILIFSFYVLLLTESGASSQPSSQPAVLYRIIAFLAVLLSLRQKEVPAFLRPVSSSCRLLLLRPSRDRFDYFSLPFLLILLDLVTKLYGSYSSKQ